MCLTGNEHSGIDHRTLIASSVFTGGVPVPPPGAPKKMYKGDPSVLSSNGPKFIRMCKGGPLSFFLRKAQKSPPPKKKKIPAYATAYCSETRFFGYDTDGKKYNADKHRGRIFGAHVSAYMKHLAEENDEAYQRQFSGFIKGGYER